MPSKSTKKPKTTKKSTKKPQKQGKKSSIQEPPKIANQGSELLPEQYAQMWVLREEGLSLREIGRQVGCHAKTVQREFSKDPARHASLVRAQAEERAAVWRQIENHSLRVLRDVIEDAGEILRTPAGRKRTKFSEGQTQKADMIRKLIGPLRMAADSATNKSQLLAGKPTEIVGGGGGLGLDPTQMNEDDVLQLAIEHDLIHLLPAALREKVEKKQGDKDP